MLEDLNLKSLDKTRAGELFIEGVKEVEKSYEKNGDVEGARSVTLKVSFNKDGNMVIADMSVAVSTPSRKVKTIAAIDETGLKIDTQSNDARQPVLTGLDEKESKESNEKVADKKIGE